MTIRDHDLHLFNTLTRAKERFDPLVPGHVGIYVCGPTVYSDTHLGHGKSYVSFDVIVRYLRHLGFRVRYVQNITDVGHLTDDGDEGDDKLQRRARLDQVHPLEIAETYTRTYLRDMDALKVGRADIYPRATGHILEQIGLVRRLIELGHAYVVGGSVYFSVGSWPAYGELSGRQGEEAEEGHRVEVRGDKRDPRDFALWKNAEGGHILKWESPWGLGFPGWHIECSAMSTKYLGEEFDIHGGGLDNQFPHHECEIAQSRACGMPFARYWLHNNMIKVGDQKMSKSLGNFVTVQDALAAHAPETVRFVLLSTHYRSPANYTAQSLEGAEGGLTRLRNALRALEERARASGEAPAAGDGGLAQIREALDGAFHRAMDDDFNTPLAIAALFDAVRQVNTVLAAPAPLSSQALAQTSDLLLELGEGVLGIVGSQKDGAGPIDVGSLVELAIELRAEARARKDFALADRIRQGLDQRGYELKDGAEGTTWSSK